MNSAAVVEVLNSVTEDRGTQRTIAAGINTQERASEASVLSGKKKDLQEKKDKTEKELGA